jgi:hypothetical protein
MTHSRRRSHAQATGTREAARGYAAVVGFGQNELPTPGRFNRKRSAAAGVKFRSGNNLRDQRLENTCRPVI